jgi:hypothetical protein
MAWAQLAQLLALLPLSLLLVAVSPKPVAKALF